MNSLDIILYILGAGVLFLLFTAGYALGHKDGKREGYTLGRSIARSAKERILSGGSYTTVEIVDYKTRKGVL